MRNHRPDRVAELLKEEIGDIIDYELKDERIPPVTITYVKLSPDLRHARVFVTIQKAEQGRERTIGALNHAGGFIRAELFSRIQLRHMPEITFAYDDSVARAERIERILKEVL